MKNITIDTNNNAINTAAAVRSYADTVTHVRPYNHIPRLAVGESVSAHKTVVREVRRVIIEEVEEVVEKSVLEMWRDVVREIGGRRITRFTVMFDFDKYPVLRKSTKRLCLVMNDTNCTMLKNDGFKVMDRTEGVKQKYKEVFNIKAGSIGDVKFEKVGKEGRTDKYVLFVREVDMGYWRFDIEVSSNSY